MAYNFYGDLYKHEVVNCLKERGYPVKSVHKLNLVLEEMGLQKHYGNHWLTTEEGAKFTIYKGRGYDADGWHPEIIDAVCVYLDRNNS